MIIMIYLIIFCFFNCIRKLLFLIFFEDFKILEEGLFRVLVEVDIIVVIYLCLFVFVLKGC